MVGPLSKITRIGPDVVIKKPVKGVKVPPAERFGPLPRFRGGSRGGGSRRPTPNQNIVTSSRVILGPSGKVVTRITVRGGGKVLIENLRTGTSRTQSFQGIHASKVQLRSGERTDAGPRGSISSIQPSSGAFGPRKPQTVSPTPISSRNILQSVRLFGKGSTKTPKSLSLGITSARPPSISPRSTQRQQFAFDLLQSVNAPIISRDEPFRTRLQKTAFTSTALLGKGFGSAFRTAKEKPIRTGLFLAGTAAGVTAAGGGIALATGLGVRTATSLAGTGLTAGFLTFKELRQPGSVTTLPGAISTAGELGPIAVGVQGVKAGVTSARFLSPRFIPSFRLPQQVKPPKRSTEQIPIFEGTTRTTSAVEQISGKGTGTFFTTSATTPREFFGPFRRTRKVLGQAKFKVKEAAIENLGADRRKFEENFLFTSKSEVFAGFGQEGVARLGARKTRGGEVRPISTRFSEIFIRGQTPTILRFQQEKITPFSKKSVSDILAGKTGSKIRRQLVKEVKLGEGIRPGTRTSALGGEREFVIKPGTDIFLKRGPERFTFLPESRSFSKVLDVGLTPGRASVGKLNIKGRLGNIGETFLSDVLGVRSFRGKRITERIPQFKEPKLPKSIAPSARGRVPGTVPRVRLPTRPRQSPIRFREPLGRVSTPRFREPTRTRTPTRPRDSVRPREPVRPRDPVRPPRIPTRPRDPFRPPRLRPPRAPPTRRPPFRPPRIPVLRTPPTRPPVFTLRLPPLGKPEKKKRLPKELQLKTVFQPSIIAIQKQIRGKKPDLLTGIEVRPITV